MISGVRRLQAHIPGFWLLTQTLRKTIPKHIQIHDFRCPATPGPYSWFLTAYTSPKENHIQTYANHIVLLFQFHVDVSLHQIIYIF